jgi:hypothetical protein
MDTADVIFDENIPARRTTYFLDLFSAPKAEDPTPRDLSSYKYLEGTLHIDDEDRCLYQITRVVVKHGYIIAFRARMRPDGTTSGEDPTGFEVADMVNAQKQYQDATKMPPTSSPSVTQGEPTGTAVPPPPRVEPVPGKRSRQPRVLMNASTLGNTAMNATCEISNASADSQNTPATHAQAMASPQADQWKKAIVEELDQLKRFETWVVVNAQEAGTKDVLRAGFIFKIKLDSQGNIAKYKARFVAKGYSQSEGENYFDVFAPVARAESVRIVLAIAAALGLYLEQMDVVNAFLNAVVEEDIYLRPPKELGIEDGKLLKLKKALYGIKQAPRQFNKLINAFLVSLGFIRSISDNCIYARFRGDETIILVLYVDDLIIAGSSMAEINTVKRALSQEYEMKDLGKLEWCLGMQISQSLNRRTVTLDQQTYAKSLVKQFGMMDAGPVGTPMEHGLRLPHDLTGERPEDMEYALKFPYRSIVGGLMYLMSCTRPDLAFSVCYLARFSTKVSKTACIAVKRVLQYVNCTLDRKLVYTDRGPKGEIVGYGDAAYGDNIDTGRSTQGYAFFLGHSLISWNSNVQSIVALSTAEAEYMCLGHTMKQGLWLRSLLAELHYLSDSATVIFEDNESAIDLAYNPVHHKRSKHIHIKWHFVREKVAAQLFRIYPLDTSRMLADVFTKALAKTPFLTLVARMYGYEGEELDETRMNKRPRHY